MQSCEFLEQVHGVVSFVPPLSPYFSHPTMTKVRSGVWSTTRPSFAGSPQLPPLAVCICIRPSRSPSSCRVFQISFTHLHLKNRWAPSSRTLLHITHLVSMSMPLLAKFDHRASESCANLHTKCFTLFGTDKPQIFFQKPWSVSTINMHPTCS